MKTLKTTSESSEKARAFTLVELMVAITIICILAALIFPAFASAKAKSNRIKCVNNLKQIGLVLRGFANSNDNRFPWQLTLGGLKYHFGSENPMCTKSVFSLQAIKIENGGCEDELTILNLLFIQRITGRFVGYR